jgi:hypothetical protein
LFQHAPYVPLRLGRPGQCVRLSPDALAACVSSTKPANNAAAATGRLDLMVIDVFRLHWIRLERRHPSPHKG